jgi:hypothetical protein
VPTQIAPLNTIQDKTPSYQWTKVSGATNYHYQVYQDSTLLVDVRILSKSCGSSICSQNPDFRLKNENYKWRVRARVNGMWMPWSTFAIFFVSAPAFSSEFNGSINGWKSKGNIDWSLLPTKVIAHGEYMKWANLYRTSGTFSDFVYSARVKRVNPSGNSCLAYRMGTYLGNKNNDWYPGYLFCLGEDWQYTVIRYDSPGSYTTLHEFSPAASIVVDGWNELTVEALANLFVFSINGVEVASVEDDAYPTGYIGFSMYRSSTLSTAFMVDWARVSVLLNGSDFERANVQE